MFALLALAASAAEVRAACVQSGSSVTCTGVDPDGFGTGVEDGLAVTVQNGAIVQNGPNLTAIRVRSNNLVANGGAVVSSFNGISVLNNSTVVNTGTITAQNSGIGVTQNNIVTNAGQIFARFGIVANAVISGPSQITNTGLVSAGTGGQAIALFGNGHTISNSGLLIAGDGGRGIEATLSNSVTIVNSGTIATGANTYGIVLRSNNTIINSGLVSAGSGLPAISVENFSTITNSGTVFGATNSVFGEGGGNVINNSGTLDGRISLGSIFGSIGANFVTNSGLITITDPNRAVGAMHSTSGTFTQTDAGRLHLRVNNLGAADRLGSRAAGIGFTGKAVLGGTLGAVVQPGLYPTSTSYAGVVVTDDPIVTRFARVQALSAGSAQPLVFFSAAAVYNPTTVDLVLTRRPFTAGFTGNARAVGAALEAFYAPTLTGLPAAFYSALLQSTSTGVLDQLSGEGLAGAQQAAFRTGGLFNRAVADQVDLWRLGGRNGIVEGSAITGYAAETRIADVFNADLKAPAAAPAWQPSWSAWVAGFGGRQSLSGDAGLGSAGGGNSAVGGALGLDYAVHPNVLVGVGVGLSESRFDVPDRATSGDSDNRHVGVYAGLRFGGSYLSALASYGRVDNRTRRTITGAGTTEFAGAGFRAEQVGGRVEVGHRFAWDRFGVTPFAALQASELRQDGFTEASITTAGGLGVLGLTVAPATVRSLPTFVGAQLDTTVALGGMLLSPFLRAAWVHEFEPSRRLTSGFGTIPGTAFTVDGARPSRDALKLDAGARLAISRHAALTASFDGEFGDGSSAYAASGALRVSW